MSVHFLTTKKLDGSHFAEVATAVYGHWGLLQLQLQYTIYVDFAVPHLQQEGHNSGLANK